MAGESSWNHRMESATECRQLANQLNELSRTDDVRPPVAQLLRALAVSWKKLAGQMDRLAERDPEIAQRADRAAEGHGKSGQSGSRCHECPRSGFSP
jgi:hypothetical protein